MVKTDIDAVDDQHKQRALIDIGCGGVIATFARMVRGQLFANQLRTRLITGTVWTILATIGTQVFTLIGTVVLARLLGKNAFGQLGLINSTIVTMGVFTGLGMGLTANKYVAEYHRSDALLAGRVIGVTLAATMLTGGVLFLSLFIAAPIFAKVLLGAPELSSAIRVVSPLILLNAMNGAQIGALSGFEAFRSLAILSVAMGMFQLVAVVSGATIGGLQGVLGAMVCAAIISYLFHQLTLRRLCYQRSVRILFCMDKKILRVLWAFTIPAFVTAVGSQPFTWIARIQLSRLPNGFSELGIFSAAFAWSNLLLFLPQQVTRSSIPIMSSLQGNREHRMIVKIFRINLVLALLSATVVGAPLAIFSGIIMKAYGEEYKNGNCVLVIIVLAYIMGSATIVVRSLNSALGTMWRQVGYAIIWGVTLVVATAVLLSEGAKGLALAHLMAFAVTFGVQLFTNRGMIWGNTK